MKNLLFIFVFVFAFTFMQGQDPIANGDFENWTTIPDYNGTGQPVELADDWEVTVAEVSGTVSTYIEKISSDPYSGDYCIKVFNRTNAMGYCGSVDFNGMMNGKIAHDFGGEKPTSLNGYYKFMGFNDDPMYINVALWNGETQISDDAYTSPDQKYTWTKFSIPIGYTGAGNPDGMNISLLSTFGMSWSLGTFIMLDSLWFDYSGCATTLHFDTQAQSVVAEISKPASFTVDMGTSGTGTVKYQWKFSNDDGVTWNDASGTNNEATYTIASVQESDYGKYKCVVDDDNNCPRESYIADLTSNFINEVINKDNIVVFPVPAKNFFNYTLGGESIDKIELYDVIGRLKYENNNIRTSFGKISVSDFADGVYMMKMYKGNSFITKRIAVKN